MSSLIRIGGFYTNFSPVLSCDISKVGIGSIVFWDFLDLDFSMPLDNAKVEVTYP